MDPLHSAVTIGDVVKGLATLLVGVLTVLYGTLVRRMDRLEEDQKNKADKSAIEEVKEMVSEHRREVQQNFQATQSTLHQILLRMGGEK